MEFSAEVILQITRDVCSSIMSLEVDPSETDPHRGGEADTLAGYVLIAGGWNGAVCVHCSARLGRLLAARMFGGDPQLISVDQTQDALGEVANMIAGQVKALSPQGAVLSLPAVVWGTDYRVRVPGSELLAEITMSCQGMPLLVTLFQALPAVKKAVAA